MNAGEAPPFGALLRELRLSKRLTQEGLAERAHLSVEAISALERGSRKAPYPHTVALLVGALELDHDAREQLEAAAARTPPGRERRPAPAATPLDELAPRHNFPERLTRFVGRDAELAALDGLLSRHRLTTIAGAGGVGKTRTAIELGARVCHRYAHGARFVDLAPLREPALLPQEIAAALQLRESPGQTVLENIVAALQGRRMLLVIDNCEHLIVAAADVLETVLRRCPGVTIVATSREALRIDGEAVYRLATFSVPERDVRHSVETALRHSSVALFVERAQSIDSSFRFDNGNVGDVARICRRVDGIPLALEIVAAQISVMAPAQIAGRLQHRFLHSEGSRTAVPRQRTIRSLVAWSVDLLSAAERVLFCRLAVFSGAWTIEAAESVCGGDSAHADSVLDQLQALVQKSLVVAENDRDGRRRFRLLEMTRAYAHELLTERFEYDAVMRRHAAYVLAFARAAGSSVEAVPDLAWLESIEREIENVRAVLEWSLGQRNDIPAGAEVAAMLGHYWLYRSHEEGKRWLAIARDSVELLEPGLAARVTLKSIRIEPYLSEGYTLVRRALEDFRRLGNGPGMFEALEVLGKTLINLGHNLEACEALIEAIALAQAADDTPSIARLTTTLGFAQLYLGDVETAVATLSQANAMLDDGAHIRDSALPVRGFAEAALMNGESDRAITLALRVLTSLERLGDRREAAVARMLLANCLLAAGRLGDAAGEIRQAIGALHGAQMPLPFLEAAIIAAAVFERQRDDARAVRLIGYAQHQIATFPFRPPPLIGALLDDAIAALTNRIGPAHFRALSAQGRAFDDERVIAEVAFESVV